MITKNGKNLQNLENTVQTLKELVEQHYEIDRVLADLGITVVGTVLAQPPEVLGLIGTKWGEAYPQRVGGTLEYWVWTRPSAGTEDIARGVWLNIGPLAIPGPEGPRGIGEKGEPGESTRWYIGATPAEVASPKIGDIFLNNSNGQVYQYSESGWGYSQLSLIGPPGSQGVPGISIKGDRGEPGPKGDKGDYSPAIHVIGVLASLEDLADITPSSNYAGKGFIIKEGDVSTIYVCVVAAEEPHDYTWENAGVLTGYSVITAGGELISEWNADTKLDKVTSTSEYERAYCIGTKGDQHTIKIGAGYPHANTLVVRQNAGQIQTGEPTEDRHATTKKYVDDGLNGKLNAITRTSNYPQVYQKSTNGEQSMRDLIQNVYSSDTWANHGYSIAQRDNDGAVRGPDPIEANHYATKQYVDANATPKLYRHTIYASCYGNDYDGQSHSINMHFEIISTQSTSASAYYVPVDKFVTLLAGPTAVAANVVPNGRCDDVPIGRVSFTRSSSIITAFNEYDEVIAAFQEENGVCEDHVTPIA